MTRRSVPRGFSLAELLVSLAVVAIVLTIVLGFTLAQKGIVEGGEMERAATEQSRDALFEIERNLRSAGFGVDPRFAFDFDSFRCTDDDQIVGEGARPHCRDRRNASDTLVFLTRDPEYRIDPQGTGGCADANGCPKGRAWRLNDTVANTLTLDARAGDLFRSGQVLLGVCPKGFRWSMATVSETVQAEADGALELTLYEANPAEPSLESDFTHACFGTGATVFAVKRFLYGIRTYDGVPWLVRDEGLDLDGDGSDPWEEEDPDDLVPLVPYVEDLQVAYVLERRAGAVPPDSDENFVVGDDAAEVRLTEEPDPNAAAPAYNTGLDDPLRRNLHPANIRAVRVSLVVRTERSVPQQGGGSAHGDPLPQPENSIRTVDEDGYRRFVVSATVAVRNMSSRAMFVH